MSKYDPLWDYLRADGGERQELSFDRIGAIVGFPLDHAFLTYKKEAAAFGYTVEKISLKGQTVQFRRCKT